MRRDGTYRIGVGRLTRGFVYWLQVQAADAPIKIGFSTHPRKRMAHFESASPFSLRLLGLRPGYMTDERALHAELAPHGYRDRNEWYHATPEVLATIPPSAITDECVAVVDDARFLRSRSVGVPLHGPIRAAMDELFRSAA